MSPEQEKLVVADLLNNFVSESFNQVEESCFLFEVNDNARLSRPDRCNILVLCSIYATRNEFEGFNLAVLSSKVLNSLVSVLNVPMDSVKVMFVYCGEVDGFDLQGKCASLW
eukprot:snap_masked-scaffold_7-processed-gene-6.12-mRNA-1 protein AED:1.00 eAED:1.00 QI:0/-1/0/0/-1/1/1/0/111